MKPRPALVLLATGVVLLGVALVLPPSRLAASLPSVQRVEAHGTLSPGVHRFGDLIEGRLDVIVPVAQADPRTVGVVAGFAPYRLIGPLRLQRHRDGATELLRYRFALECLETGCVPRQDRVGFSFPAARIHYRTASGADAWVAAAWPALVVRPRPRVDIFTPWEDGLRPLPALSYRLPPRLAAVLAALLAAVALGGAAALVRPLVRRAETAPGGHTSLLERALAAVRAAAAREDVDERRRALDLLARALRRGRQEESGEARRLAWSASAPAASPMEELADRVERV